MDKGGDNKTIGVAVSMEEGSNIAKIEMSINGKEMDRLEVIENSGRMIQLLESAISFINRIKKQKRNDDSSDNRKEG